VNFQVIEICNKTLKVDNYYKTKNLTTGDYEKGAMCGNFKFNNITKITIHS